MLYYAYLTARLKFIGINKMKRAGLVQDRTIKTRRSLLRRIKFQTYFHNCPCSVLAGEHTVVKHLASKEPDNSLRTKTKVEEE